MRSAAVASTVFALALAAPIASHATVLHNQNLVGAGVYFGTGNDAVPQEFTTNTADGVEIGLRSKVSGINPQVVPTGNVYDIPIGNTFNFDYSFNPGVSGQEIVVSGLTASITVHDFLSGLTATFDPTSPLLGNASGDAFGAPGGYQNSEKISFSFLDPSYNKNLDDTFTIVFTVYGLAGGPLTVDNTVIVGEGAVPEPATWSMMILGFGLAGAGLRRRRRAIRAPA